MPKFLALKVWLSIVVGHDCLGTHRHRIGIHPDPYCMLCNLREPMDRNHLGQHTALFNPLTPNYPYSGRTAPLTSKRFILYIYSTNIGNEYFKRGVHPPFFPLQNAVCFIILTYLVPVLFTFYIQGVLKLKKNNSGAKMLIGQSVSDTGEARTKVMEK